PMGRAYRIQKRKAHVTVHVSDEVKAVNARSGETKRSTAPPAAPRKTQLARGEITEASLRQKVNPYGFRLGFNKTWHSRWFAGKNYAETLHRDLKLREDLKKRLSHAGVSEIDIERTANKMRINIYTSRPGIIIGRKGAEVDKLRDELQKLVNGEVYINIQEIQRPELDS